MSTFEPREPVSPTEEYYDLGSFSRPISTKSHEAQIWFNRGLIWSDSFNQDEACRCFEQAIAHDPRYAMAFWGLAYVTGPNYNKSRAMFDPNDLKDSLRKCHHTSQKAHQLAQTEIVTPVEKALIDAIQYRFLDIDPPSDYSLQYTEPWG